MSRDRQHRRTHTRTSGTMSLGCWGRCHRGMKERSWTLKRATVTLGAGMLAFYVLSVSYTRLTRDGRCEIYRHSSYHGDLMSISTVSEHVNDVDSLGSDLNDAKLEAFVRSGQVLNEYQFVVNSEVCSSSGVPQSVYVVAIVPSKPSHFQERQAIRETWGSQFNKNEKLKLIFLSGLAEEITNMQLSSERETFFDVVQANFIDSYKNLTRKTNAMLQWSKQFCSQARFVMKIDDDVFLDTDELLQTLLHLEVEPRLIIGYIDNVERPNRDPSSKWYLSQEEYPFKQFPRFTHGPSYVISRDLVADLYEISRHAPRIHLEDVYVTGLCAHVARATHVGACGFGIASRHASMWLLGAAVTGHQYTPEVMSQSWTRVQFWRAWRAPLRCLGYIIGY
ncbi:beta-1,3-galactosyltransferase 1-like [Haliotis cracherodii]|uniref:beta-1,3-galactosyltransferase 1-like n=1 Tax=Haliotis cracherodii TaxID=6455 RepID=UPI0039EA4826